MTRLCRLLTLLLLPLASMAQAGEPAVIYQAVQFDDSFNVAANDGIQRYKKQYGNAQQAFGEKAIRRFAESGADPVIAIGWVLADEVARVAKEFPSVRFTVIDAVVKAPNVQSIVFKDNEGAFLVGMLAAMASRSGTVGFIGGMDLPLIHRFRCGYAHGARHVNPRVTVLSNMTGTTPEAWQNPQRGGELAKAQFASGADVIFAAAGGTGIGVYAAAKEAGKLAIGVDRNQNYLQPGAMLSSMLKRIDTAVYRAASGPRDGSWAGGQVLTLGLKEQGLGWTLDRHNQALVSPEMQRRVATAEAEIVAGSIAVQDVDQGNACR
jgi:basic membrane protein A